MVVFIYAQHLLGIGHLRRMSFLASALVTQGFQVHLVSGGMPVSNLAVDNIQLHQLPPVRSTDGKFDQLVDEHDRPITQLWQEKRSTKLLALYDAFGPDVLITETFPFGRRMMRFELLPLLKRAKQGSKPPLILSSIRDILQPKQKPQRNQEVLDWINLFYDKVLVHGDDSIATLGASFPFANEITDKTFYSGFIVDPDTPNDFKAPVESAEVLVSGGGGAASLPLLKAAIDAKPLSSLRNHTWRLLVGHNIDQMTFEALRRSARPGLVIERNRNDFADLLRSCAVSVSQAGYNTVMDILKAEARAVLVPYADSGELEQTIRATLLQAQGRAISVDEKALSAQTLASAIDQAILNPVPKTQYQMDGANMSAKLIKGWLN
ncbi:MAG: putative glycosyltransferase [Gammaproteobacteria bacterium]|jgi:predicted glycosyltransferase